MEQPFGFTLNQLLHFVVVAQAGSVSTAAARLRTTQSAVSMSIKRLEGNLKTVLFERHSSNGMKLTRQGVNYLRLAENVVADSRAISQEAAKPSQNPQIVRVGTLQSLAPMLVGHLRPAFLHKRKQVSILEGTAQEWLEWLRQEICAAAIGLSFGEYPLHQGQPGRHPELEFTSVTTANVVPLVSKKHPLTRFRSVSIPQLSHYQVAVIADGLNGLYLQELLQAATAAHHSTVRSMETLLSLVESGSCVAFVPEIIVETRLRSMTGIRTLTLDTELPPVQLGVFFLRKNSDTDAVQTVVDVAGRQFNNTES
ncbi:LysR family transcriptional regulator [Nocardia sp. NPDC051570]|uniref:LysR family transcriptional regulator n=1 Tax=Nocardia sp. NPDC051570 TaxID=3364324 RepID=UPI0037977D6D